MRRCLSCDHAFAGESWTCPSCGHAPPVDAGFPCFASDVAHVNENYDPKHFRLLADLEDRSFWFPARNRLIVWAFNRFFSGAHTIIEVGVGTGYVMRALHKALPHARAWASDIHVEGLRSAAARLSRDVDLIQMDARQIPFRDHFDVACACDVLEHIRDDRAALAEMRRALIPGGGIVLTVPQHMFLWGPADEAARHERRYEAGELAEKVQTAGFEVIFQTSFISLLLPALYLSRLRSRQSGRYDLADELASHRVLNRVFTGVSSLEARLIRAGLASPVGGSRLLVAIRRR